MPPLVWPAKSTQPDVFLAPTPAFYHKLVFAVGPAECGKVSSGRRSFFTSHICPLRRRVFLYISRAACKKFEVFNPSPTSRAAVNLTLCSFHSCPRRNVK